MLNDSKVYRSAIFQPADFGNVLVFAGFFKKRLIWVKKTMNIKNLLNI